MQRGRVVLPKRLNNALRSALLERDRESLSGRLRMPTRLTGGTYAYAYGGVQPRLLLFGREH